MRFFLPTLMLLLPGLAAAQDSPPAEPREFRAVWVATVENIDWPTRPGLSTEEQKKEALAILDKVAELRMNAVVLQVRTAADALYESELEPWSAVLTGEQGKAPAPYYDPLAFWVEEAHKRGLQLHAWFNPFRAKPAGSKYANSADHVSKAHPDWVRSYGNYLWMDPGVAEARDHTLAVMADVAKRYDVDGLHIDDYFYPYPVAKPEGGGEIEFPDDEPWADYQKAGGKLGRHDWRRDNINKLVESMYRVARETKPGLQVGISPFGIARPGKPAGVVGFDQYASLYADTELWLRNGWCDYWTPQLYWKIEAKGQPFRPLLNHWASQNEKGRHLWPGLSISRVSDRENGYAPEEITGQIDIIRETVKLPGHVLFSMKALPANKRGLADKLATTVYADAALVPPTPWLDDEAPGRPKVAIEGEGNDRKLIVKPASGEETFTYVVWTLRETAWSLGIVPASATEIPLRGAPARVVVKAVDRLGNVSEAVEAQ